VNHFAPHEDYFQRTMAIMPPMLDEFTAKHAARANVICVCFSLGRMSTFEDIKTFYLPVLKKHVSHNNQIILCTFVQLLGQFCCFSITKHFALSRNTQWVYKQIC
jgi:hypothetical protein